MLNVKKQQESTWQLNGLEYNAKENVVGFFNLLLQVDARVNPHLYKKSIHKSYVGHSSTDNSGE